ncbi:MAG: phage holin family protein [Bacteroidales bacterium]|nr:phage holin family protein [Bacteroidales bacterium]
MKITINHNGGFYTGRGGCLTRLMLLCIAVMVGAWLLPGVEVSSFWAVFLTAVAISLLNNIIRPILVVITLPVTAVTLGLFLFVINAIIILMASALVSGFHVENFGSALLFSLVLMAVNYLLELPNKYLDRKPLGQQSRNDGDDDTDDEGFTPYEEIKD